MALVAAKDIKNAAELLGTDLIIAYGLCHIHHYVPQQLTAVTG